jgi:hypothetical protein
VCRAPTALADQESFWRILVVDARQDTRAWTRLVDEITERAVKLPIADVVARWDEATRLVLAQLGHELEVCWRNSDGQEIAGLPPGWAHDYARYDRARDAIVEKLPNGRVIYDVKTRKNVRRPNPFKSLIKSADPLASSHPLAHFAQQTQELQRQFVDDEIDEAVAGSAAQPAQQLPIETGKGASPEATAVSGAQLTQSTESEKTASPEPVADSGARTTHDQVEERPSEVQAVQESTARAVEEKPASAEPHQVKVENPERQWTWPEVTGHEVLRVHQFIKKNFSPRDFFLPNGRRFSISVILK